MATCFCCNNAVEYLTSTVQPQRHGHWSQTETSSALCSCCGTEWRTHWTYYVSHCCVRVRVTVRFYPAFFS